MRQHFYIGLILLSHCKTKDKTETQDNNNIFGKWEVVDAKFIQADKWNGNTTLDTKALSDNYLRYVYIFNDDSTFQRGKPDVKHLNVEEAHGRFSLTRDKKAMHWYLRFSNRDAIDTVDIEVLKMTNSTIVLVEGMGGGNKIEHNLERVDE